MKRNLLSYSRLKACNYAEKIENRISRLKVDVVLFANHNEKIVLKTSDRCHIGVDQNKIYYFLRLPKYFLLTSSWKTNLLGLNLEQETSESIRNIF